MGLCETRLHSTSFDDIAPNWNPFYDAKEQISLYLQHSDKALGSTFTKPPTIPEIGQVIIEYCDSVMTECPYRYRDLRSPEMTDELISGDDVKTAGINCWVNYEAASSVIFFRKRQKNHSGDASARGR